MGGLSPPSQRPLALATYAVRVGSHAVPVAGNNQDEGAEGVHVWRGSRVGGSVQVVQGGKASVVRSRININRNVVGGNLQCNEHRTMPRGGRNVVQGNKENQCRRL